MEVYFSSVAEQDTALYILSHYPRVAVGMVGSNESLKYALEKQGNKVYMYDKFNEFQLEFLCIPVIILSYFSNLRKSYKVS